MLGISCRASILWLVPALLPGIAAAQGDRTEEARVHFEAGTQAFDVGEFDRAAEEFQAAYEITEHPDLLFNIYSSLERMGELEPAAAALEGYLDAVELPDDRRTALSARLARLRERIAEARATAAEAELARAREQAERDAQGRAEPQSAQQPEPAPPPPSRGPHVAGVVTTVAAGVVLANFGVFAALSEVEDGNLTTLCGTSCAADQVGTLEAYNIVADVSWIAGAALAVAGIVMLLVLEEDAPSESAAIAPWATPDGAGAAIVGRF